jgi:hypothetical protein
MYDARTVATVTGDVVEVAQKASGRGGSSGGVHVTLKTADGNIAVRLGPTWYLEEKGLQLRAGDRIEVRGSRIRLDEKPVLIAAEVTKGEHRVRLRDDSGVPAWRGAGGARRQTP